MRMLTCWQVVAVNGVSDKVSVVKKDISLLERGKEVRYLGANLAIGDIFDAGKLPCPSATQLVMLWTCGPFGKIPLAYSADIPRPEGPLSWARSELSLSSAQHMGGSLHGLRSFTEAAVRQEGESVAAGLLGSNWLFHLEMAKKKVLQASATVIPAAATLYCMGIEARTGLIAGFDLSSFNKYRSATALIRKARASLKCWFAGCSALMNGAYQGCMWLAHCMTGVVAA